MSTSNQAEPSPPPTVVRRRLDLRGLHRRVPASAVRAVWRDVIPVGVALVSLILSLYTLFEARQAPTVVLTMPAVVRLSQGPDAAWLYLQPLFVNTGSNNRVEVIADLKVMAQHDDGEAVAFRLDELGTWEYDQETGFLNWAFASDPAPLVVGPTAPQYPIGLFIAPPGWHWQAGDYQLTVTASRAVGGTPLQGRVKLTLTEDHVAYLNANRGGFLQMPTAPMS